MTVDAVLLQIKLAIYIVEYAWIQSKGLFQHSITVHSNHWYGTIIPFSIDYILHGTARVSEIGALQVPWNSMEFHGTALFSEIGALQVPWKSVELLVSAKLAHSKLHGIPWNSMELLVSAKLAHSKFHGIPWNCSCQRNWRTPSSKICFKFGYNSVEFEFPTARVSEIGDLQVPWSSIKFHGTARVSEIGTLQVPWNFMELLVSAKLTHSKFHGIPWNSSCHRNWPTPSSMEFHGIQWNCSCQQNWRTPSSMEFQWTARVSEIGALQVTKFVLNLDRIPWNLSFQILMKIIFNFSGWINFRKVISTLYLLVSLVHQLMFNFIYLPYTICISGITHYVSKYHSKSLFYAHWNLFWSKSSIVLSPEFHGTFWTTFEQHLWFHGIPWNLSNKTSSSIEFHRILSRSKVPWNSMELCPCSRVPWNSVEFHETFNFSEKSSMGGIPWNYFEVPWNSMELDWFDI